MSSRSYRDLVVWQKSIELCEFIYQICSTFPSSELYGLTSQMKRSAISISSNIAEGQARKQPSEFRRFLFIANGSLAELDTQCYLAKRLNFVTQEIFEELETKIIRLQKMIFTLIRTIESKPKTKN